MSVIGGSLSDPCDERSRGQCSAQLAIVGIVDEHSHVHIAYAPNTS